MFHAPNVLVFSLLDEDSFNSSQNRGGVKVDGFFIVTKLSELRIVKEEIKKIIRKEKPISRS